jgi:hypothetical protein
VLAKKVEETPMCRSSSDPKGKKRCGSKSDPAKRAAYNAVRRERYKASKNSASLNTVTGQTIIINEDELFSEEIVDRYSGGECYRLANETYRIAKVKYPEWKFVAVVPDIDGMEDEWVHMSVLTDNNELLDIDGLNNLDEIVYGNNKFLDERWSWYLKEHYKHKTGIDKYDMKAKMVVIEDEAHYQKLIKGQGEGATTDADATETAQRLMTWYEQEKAN